MTQWLRCYAAIFKDKDLNLAITAIFMVEAKNKHLCVAISWSPGRLNWSIAPITVRLKVQLWHAMQKKKKKSYVLELLWLPSYIGVM